MSIPVEVLAQVTPGNLRMPQETFGAMWSDAEALLSQARPGVARDYLQGVVDTCRWVAGSDSTSELVGRPTVPLTPTHHELTSSMPETIDAEYHAARRARGRARRQMAVTGDTGDREHGIARTLEWLWLGSATPISDAMRRLVEAL